MDHGPGTILAAAMAAIGTQYAGDVKSRHVGTDLHYFCRNNLDLCPWSIQKSQAILLTELFRTFRARKTSIGISPQFEELYKRLSHDLLPPRTRFDVSKSQQLSPDDNWTDWIDEEARRRLLIGCFIFYNHQAIYHEQIRLNPIHSESIISFLSTPSVDYLWKAPTATEWCRLYRDHGPHPPSIQGSKDIRSISTKSPFAQMLLISSLASQLPARPRGCDGENSLLTSSTAFSTLTINFPASSLVNTYLGLYYTPLYELLAVSGETWVFAKKVAPPSAYAAAQKRLSTWSSSLAAAAATKYACKVLQSFILDQYDSSPPKLQRKGPGDGCISEYWGLYTSALICWAFGYRYQNSSSPSRARSATVTTVTADNLTHSTRFSTVEQARSKALMYINSMLGMTEQELCSSKATLRGETAGVLEVVQMRLEMDGVGDQSMSIVDAVDVLKRLRKNHRGRWF